jgi:hypothetical protein
MIRRRQEMDKERIASIEQIVREFRRAWYFQDSFIRFDSTLNLSESGVPTDRHIQGLISNPSSIHDT